MESSLLSKNKLRDHFHQLLKSTIQNEWSILLEQRLQDCINQLDLVHRLKGGFYPLSSEPNLTRLYQKLPFWCFPRWDHEHMVFIKVAEFTEASLAQWGNHMGVKYPQTGDLVDKSEIAMILIPGLAFDLLGYRLGRGRGFFDRFLKNFKGIKIGVGFELQILKELPRDHWDQSLDFLITEKQIYSFKKGV